MRLKYYLRGIGVGIFVTTILFMILISVNQNSGLSQQVSDQEEQSKTIADYENQAQGETNTEQGGQAADLPDANQPADTQPEAEQPADTPDVQPDATQPADTPDAVQPADARPKSGKAGKVRFIISGGEYSDVICRKLAEAGLVDDADEYNNFLIEENYDNFINPGVYDIPKDATYEEIAVLLTTKVE